MARAYLDHASSSPLRPAAFEAMLPYLRGHPGDPGRLHAEGRETRIAVEVAREQVATLFGARPREVVFTATGTESVNTAIWGAVERARSGSDRHHVVTTAVEHSAVLDAVARSGFETTVVGVDGRGRFAAPEVLAAVRDDTALVSVQLANHEVGTMQTAVAEIVAGARDRGAVVHVDACAASGHVPVDFAALGADLCSVDGPSWGAPKGAAALLVRRGLRFPPFVVGGAQERARRGGLEDVPALVGFGAAAAELSDGATLVGEATRARSLTDALAAAALAEPGVTRFGDPTDRLPHLVCVGIDGVEAEPVLLGLDQRGVAVHSGSSCSSELLEPSPVLAAMGVDAERSLRASVGWSSTDDDVDRFATAFPEVVTRLRALRGG
ncbi:MAG: cysteine desulfurase [Actinobacteria bacterium]|nr:cysteine desulfurase [Actinomycetota bacterium]